jgi:hypothetical protein
MLQNVKSTSPTHRLSVLEVPTDLIDAACVTDDADEDELATSDAVMWLLPPVPPSVL